MKCDICGKKGLQEREVYIRIGGGQMVCDRCRWEGMKAILTPVYLRDLREGLQDEYLRGWASKIRKRPDLLKAAKAGEDIIVGYYMENGNEEVEE